MDDREFFDTLFQMWASTTRAANSFWGYEETLEEQFDLFATTEQEKIFIGYMESDADADFLTAIHGCLPDLVRKLHSALDESDRLDYEMDLMQDKIGQLETEISQLKQQLKENSA